MFDFRFWRPCLAILVFTISFIFGLLMGPGCASPLPTIDIKTWAGDSKIEGIQRAQDKKSISCKDPEFDQMICMTYEDLKKIYLTLPKCKAWSL